MLRSAPPIAARPGHNPVNKINSFPTLCWFWAFFLVENLRSHSERSKTVYHKFTREIWSIVKLPNLSIKGGSYVAASKRVAPFPRELHGQMLKEVQFYSFLLAPKNSKRILRHSMNLINFNNYRARMYKRSWSVNLRNCAQTVKTKNF